MFRTGITALVGLLLSATFFMRPVWAWNQDVHYDLTFWLASKAGFSRPDAYRIAEGCQSYDDSAHAGAIPTMLLIVLTADARAAESVRDKHFPSDAPLPSPPTVRVVQPGRDPARKAIKQVIDRDDRTIDLLALGQAIHPFQDSWSHQGVPGVPLGLKPNFSYAHPDTRGGWWSHDADYTHLHVDDAMATAEETYKVFQAFLQKHPRFRVAPAVPWAQLRSTVQEFAQARTQPQKIAWAVKNIPEPSSPTAQVAVVRMTRDGAGGVLGLDDRGEPAPTELLSQAVAFFGAWFTEHDIERATSFVEASELQQQFLDSRVDLRAPDALAAWIDKSLTIEIVADHAAVNAAGHGDPRQPGYARLPRRAQTEGEFRAADPVEIPLTTEDFFRSSGPASELSSGDYGQMLTTSPTLPDGVALVWRQFSTGWKIVRLVILPG